MIATMVFFLSTSRERDIIVAMRSIRMPLAVVTYVFAMALRAARIGVVKIFRSSARQSRPAGSNTAGKSLIYKIRQYIMYMIPLFALSLRRSEEFTNALVARGYAFTGEAAKVKRADFVLTHYQFRGHDIAFTVLIVALFAALLFFRFNYGAFNLDDSWINLLFSPYN